MKNSNNMQIFKNIIKQKGGFFMGKLSTIDWIAIILVIIGGLNWGLVGLFEFNLVQAIFGEMSVISKAIYTLVGLSALYLIKIVASMTE